MALFANHFSVNEIRLQPVTRIPWGTLVIVIIPKFSLHEEMLWYINEIKTWGSKYIKNLANDLKEYGKGYSISNLKRMCRIASEFSYNEFSAQVARQIPWFTLIEIVQNSSSHEEMLWYINETYKNGWSRAMVLNQIA